MCQQSRQLRKVHPLRRTRAKAEREGGRSGAHAGSVLVEVDGTAAYIERKCPEGSDVDIDVGRGHLRADCERSITPEERPRVERIREVDTNFELESEGAFEGNHFVRTDFQQTPGTGNLGNRAEGIEIEVQVQRSAERSSETNVEDQRLILEHQVERRRDAGEDPREFVLQGLLEVFERRHTVLRPLHLRNEFEKIFGEAQELAGRTSKPRNLNAHQVGLRHTDQRLGQRFERR